MTRLEWKNINEELPEHDGKYIVSNNPELDSGVIMDYDGYGFLYSGAYRPVKFWRLLASRIKKYGKIDG